ncbi:hypothetical protein M9Y10_016235, partial [Tritrichomonas musculus]
MFFGFILPFLSYYSFAIQPQKTFLLNNIIFKTQRDSAKLKNNFYLKEEKNCDNNQKLLISDEKFTEPINIQNIKDCQSVSIFNCYFNKIYLKTKHPSIIYIANSSFSIENSGFFDCFSRHSVQGVICHSIYLDENPNHECNITNCTFINNGDSRSESDKGTIIYSKGVSAIQIEHSKFSSSNEIYSRAIEAHHCKTINLFENTFFKMNGAVFIKSSGNVDIDSCSFDQNRIEAENIGSSLYINLNESLTFRNNTIKNHKDNLSCFISFNKDHINKRSPPYEGATENIRTVLISETIFENNTCKRNKESGFIGVDIEDKNDAPTRFHIEFSECKFIRNGNTKDEGVAGVFGETGKASIVTFTNCEFESNFAHEKSSLIEIKNGEKVVIEGCRIRNPSVSGFLKFESRKNNKLVKAESGDESETEVIIRGNQFLNDNNDSVKNMISINGDSDLGSIDGITMSENEFEKVFLEEDSFMLRMNTNKLNMNNNRIEFSENSKSSEVFKLMNSQMEEINIHSGELENCQTNLRSTKVAKTTLYNTNYINHDKPTNDSIIFSNTDEFICDNCSFVYSTVHPTEKCYRAIYLDQFTTAVITNTVFRNCWASDTLEGHGIFCTNPNPETNSLTISSCTFDECGNHRTVVSTENKVVNFINNEITFGSDQDGSIGLHVKNTCQLLVDGCTFTNCNSNNVQDHRGGGIEYECTTDEDSPNETINIMNTNFNSCSGKACAISLKPKHALPIFNNITIAHSKSHRYTVMIDVDSKTEYSEPGEVLFQNSRFVDLLNLEETCGSGIWFCTKNSDNDTLSIVNCEFEGTSIQQSNTEGARLGGGAIGIELRECRNYNVIISSCSFYECTSFAFPGGAIAIQTEKTVSITDCSFNKSISLQNYNSRNAYGSIIYVYYYGNDNPFIISNATFVDAQSIGPCACIYFNTELPCPFYMHNILIKNVYSKSTAPNWREERGKVHVYEKTSYFECINTTFNNTGIPNDFTNKDIKVLNTKLLIENCNFIENGEDELTHGSCLCSRNQELGADITIKSCTFINSGRKSSVIHVFNRHLNFINNTFLFTDRNSNARGLFVCSQCNLLVENCNFTNCGNVNSDFGGGLFYKTDGNDEKVTITGCTFDRCVAANSAAFRLNMRSTIPIFLNSTVSNMKGLYCIAYVYPTDVIIYSRFTVENIKFINISNTAKDCGGSGLWINNGRNEGNIFTLFINFIDIDFIQCSTEFGGGGFGLGDSDSVKPTDLTFIRCNFIGNSCRNKASNGGGALWIRTSANCLIQNCTFKDNFSWENQKADGGCIYLSFTSDLFTMSISDSSFINNSCLNPDSLGHAIYTPILYGTISLNRCNFTDNGCNCQKPNSIIHTLSHLDANECNFTCTNKENSFSRALYVGISSPLTLYNSYVCNFTHEAENGGAIYYSSSDDRINEVLEIINDTFIDNSAVKGTEFYLSIIEEPTIKNCTFSNKYIESDLIVFDFFLGLAGDRFAVVFNELHFIENNFKGNKVLSVLAEDVEITIDEIHLLNCEFIMNDNFKFASLEDIKLTISDTLFQDNVFNNSLFFINSENETLITNGTFRNNKYLPTDGFTTDDTAVFVINQSADFYISNSAFEHENIQEDEDGNHHGFILKVRSNLFVENVSFVNCSTIKYAIFFYCNESTELDDETDQFESSLISSEEMLSSDGESDISLSSESESESGPNLLLVEEITSEEPIDESDFTIFSLVNSRVDNSGTVFITKRTNKIVVVNSTIKNAENGLFYTPKTEPPIKPIEFIHIENNTFDMMRNCSCSIKSVSDIRIRNNTIKNCKNDETSENPNFYVSIEKEGKKELNIEDFRFINNEMHNENDQRTVNGGGIGLVIELPRQRENDEDIFINFIDCEFVNNKATYYGGGYAFLKKEELSHKQIIMKFLRCTFEGNECSQEKGGALYIECDSIEIDECIFNSNSKGAKSTGTEIASLEDRSVVFIRKISHKDIKITDSSFYDNEGQSISISDSSTNVSITGCSFTSNKATTNITSIIQISIEFECNFSNNYFKLNEGYVLNIT